MKKAMIVTLVLLISGFSASAYADCGMGHGKKFHGGYHSQGYHGQGYHGQGYMKSTLSAEDIEKMNAEREAFFKATGDIRREMYSKKLELRSMMVKKEVDMEKAAALQAEISKLKAAFDQEKLKHILAMQKINPDFGMGGCGKRMGPCMMRGSGCEFSR